MDKSPSFDLINMCPDDDNDDADEKRDDNDDDDDDGDGAYGTLEHT